MNRLVTHNDKSNLGEEVANCDILKPRRNHETARNTKRLSGN